VLYGSRLGCVKAHGSPADHVAVATNVKFMSGYSALR
jgi:hypothetical protein